MFLRHITNNLDSKYHEGMADHSVSESVYIHDPDFIGIEIYIDLLQSGNGIIITIKFTWLPML
jgi:catechol-2,3-dioxygenase